MQTKTLLILVFAVGFGLMAGVGMFLKQNADGSGVETVPVLVAHADLNRGVVLTKEHLKLVKRPKNTVPAGALTDLDKASGRTVREAVAQGEVLLDNRLTELGSGRGLPPLIPRGKRAVSIQTPNISTGVAGFVVPGNKVDVLLTMHAGGTVDSSGGGTTMALLQNVTVLAVDQKIEAPSDNKIDVKDMRSVTLVVTPWEANQLDLGQNKGTLRLALRNPLDDEVTDIPNATLKRLRGGAVEVLPNGDVAATPPQSPADNTLAQAELPPSVEAASSTPAPKARRVRMPILCVRGNQMSSTELPRGVAPASQPGNPDLLVRQ